MARPERNNVDYFPLYVDNGRKMFFIETKYGNNGYATWIKILTELARANYHFINLKDDTQLMFLSAVCRVDETMLKNIINDLVKLCEFNKQLWEECSIIYSEKFVDSISDAYNKRNNKPPTLDSLRITLIDLGILKPTFQYKKSSDKPHSKEEDTKEEKKIKTDWDRLTEKWLSYKKDRKETYKSEESINKFTERLKKLSGDNIETATKIIEQSMANNWAGIFALKEESKKQDSEPIKAIWNLPKR